MLSTHCYPVCNFLIYQMGLGLVYKLYTRFDPLIFLPVHNLYIRRQIIRFTFSKHYYTEWLRLDDLTNFIMLFKIDENKKSYLASFLVVVQHSPPMKKSSLLFNHTLNLQKHYHRWSISAKTIPNFTVFHCAYFISKKTRVFFSSFS